MRMLSVYLTQQTEGTNVSVLRATVETAFTVKRMLSVSDSSGIFPISPLKYLV